MQTVKESFYSYKHHVFNLREILVRWKLLMQYIPPTHTPNRENYLSLIKDMCKILSTHTLLYEGLLETLLR